MIAASLYAKALVDRYLSGRSIDLGLLEKLAEEEREFYAYILSTAVRLFKERVGMRRDVLEEFVAQLPLKVRKVASALWS
ncbi:hypothetical protein [Thermoproteus tenax]|uniref:Uncharacterized protein n=1 Tax=Thermoproteus tenax (strain ATCC 35583 / DSM 2078 / JCM 9277 / NBRC 100435 / Kra 1) TaxID=768679 RepID=G4RMN8_THETK|nr:hypothetical protein [Thermoproteus tenax]CCC82714.1 hypothetical protein TTX_2102 [Thermoproteus tenax Kra 1]